MNAMIFNEYKHTIIIPFHKNKKLLYYVLNLLQKTISPKVEVIVIANNYNKTEIDIQSPFSQVKIYQFQRDMFYPDAMNTGVSLACGDIITMFDQDIFCYPGWYEPLFSKLISSTNIGAVSPKLINPTNNRIIDFGIAYSPQNVLHPMRGLKRNHVCAQEDRRVQSACSAVMMTYKSIYEEVGGMDITMPYICCDCDYGIQLKQKNYETWVVANSEVYHKGSSSLSNTKISEYSHLRADSKAMFFAKDYSLLCFDIKDYLVQAVCKFKETHTVFPNYYFYNLCSLQDSKFFIQIVQKTFGINFYDLFTINVGMRNPKQIQLYDYIPMSHLDISEPFIYFVDTVVSLTNNAFWWKNRKNPYDIIIDTNGNLLDREDIERMIV